MIDAVRSARPVRIKTDEYDRMADAGVFGPDRGRLELLGGHLYEMPPIGTAHLMVVTRLQVMLKSLNAEGRLLVQQPLRVAEFDEPQPDLTILRHPVFDLHVKPGAGDCQLVIEVSDSTLAYDQSVKMPAYLAGGVPVVWIVNIQTRDVEVYEISRDRDRAFIGPGGRLSFA
jgi:Uma2 family endonuclease